MPASRVGPLRAQRGGGDLGVCILIMAACRCHATVRAARAGWMQTVGRDAAWRAVPMRDSRHSSVGNLKEGFICLYEYLLKHALHFSTIIIVVVNIDINNITIIIIVIP